MWAVVAFMHDAHALCGLLHPLTLTLTMMKVQCTTRNSNPTTVAATRRLFGRVAATVVGLGFRALHCTLIMVRVRTCNSPHSTYNSPHSTYKSYIEAVTSYIEDVTAHIETVTSHIEAATAHTAYVTIKPPFEPTATAPKKMAKPFYSKGGLLPRIHID